MLIACLVVGSVLGVAAVTLLGILVLRPVHKPDEALVSKVRALDSEINDLVDQIVSWRKRDAGRKAVADATPADAPAAQPKSREELRQFFAGVKRGNNG